MSINLNKEFWEILDEIVEEEKEESLDGSWHSIGCQTTRELKYRDQNFVINLEIFWEKAHWYQANIEGENGFNHSEMRNF